MPPDNVTRDLLRSSVSTRSYKPPSAHRGAEGGSVGGTGTGQQRGHGGTQPRLSRPNRRGCLADFVPQNDLIEHSLVPPVIMDESHSFAFLPARSCCCWRYGAKEPGLSAGEAAKFPVRAPNRRGCVRGTKVCEYGTKVPQVQGN